MPYLPQDFPKSILAPWQDGVCDNNQIAALVDIMSELVRGLDGDDLVEVIEAATKLHSEWWVVEAFTLMLRRLNREADFQTVFRASRRIINSDLHARLVGKIAQRAAEFEHDDFALKIAQSLPSGLLRCDELRGLAMIFAALGQGKSALRAALAIDRLEEREKTLAQAAMELAAQQNFTEAQLLVLYLAPGLWQQRGQEAIDQARAKPGTAYPPDIGATRREQRQADRGEVIAALAANAPQRLDALTKDRQTVEAVRNAIEADDATALRAVSLTVWTTSRHDGPPLVETLARKMRGDMLQELSGLAPLLAFDPGGMVARNAIEAIADVARWWP
jgi:hypothetical protein